MCQGSSRGFLGRLRGSWVFQEVLKGLKGVKEITGVLHCVSGVFQGFSRGYSKVSNKYQMVSGDMGVSGASGRFQDFTRK